MASITLHVPAPLVGLIRDEFKRYQDVQFDVLESRPAQDRSASQRRAARLVCAIDIALHSVPWNDLGPDQSITLTTDHGLLQEVVYGTLLGVIDRLGDDCHRGSADSLNRDDIAAHVLNLSILVGLHAAADPTD